MDISIYNWKACPAIYKEMSPYTKYFFSEGGEVTMVMVIKGFHEKTELVNLLSHVKTLPTDQVGGKICGVLNRVMYWTNK